MNIFARIFNNNKEKEMLKNLTITLLLVTSIATMALGQIRTPAASPAAMVKQTVGLTDVTLEYSRPATKGRVIFGDLVPFDKVWRTGANSATKMTFSEDVMIEGQELKAGAYAILTKPGMKTWDVHFYTHESSNWSSYVEKTPTLVVTVKALAIKALAMENFSIAVADINAEGAVIQMAWEGTLVPMKLSVHTDKAVMASIEAAMAGPSTNDYYNAGSYMHDSGKDLKTALMYVQKATSGDSPRFWQVRKESLILADMGMKAEAIAAAKKSLMLATEAGNDDYIKMNNDSIKKWSM